jgi:hypothetical protein
MAAVNQPAMIVFLTRIFLPPATAMPLAIATGIS